MTDTPSRLFGVVLALVGIWVLTYWLYDPKGPRVTSEARPAPQVTMVAPPVAPAPPPPVAQRTDLIPLPTPHAARHVVPEPVADSTKPQRVQRLLPPEFREYVVQKGDVSFEAIAGRREVYGDRARWQAVSRANPFVTPDRLKPGVTKLKIAVDPDNIQGKLVWVDVGGSPGAVQAAVSKEADSAPVEVEEITYVIAEDDTLWGISKKMYGQGAQWKRIYEANRSVIKDPDRPPKGAKIRIPPPELGHAGD